MVATHTNHRTRIFNACIVTLEENRRGRNRIQISFLICVAESSPNIYKFIKSSRCECIMYKNDMINERNQNLEYTIIS